MGVDFKAGFSGQDKPTVRTALARSLTSALYCSLDLFEDPPKEEEQSCPAEDSTYKRTPFEREFHRSAEMHLRRPPDECCQTHHEKENGDPQPQTAALPGWSSAAETLRQWFSSPTFNSSVQAIELQTG